MRRTCRILWPPPRSSLARVQDGFSAPSKQRLNAREANSSFKSILLCRENCLARTTRGLTVGDAGYSWKKEVLKCRERKMKRISERYGLATPARVGGVLGTVEFVGAADRVGDARNDVFQLKPASPTVRPRVVR